MSEMNQEYKEGMDRKIIRIKMTLLSDTIFGNGMSIPGEEDISVLTDAQGFPYYKGSTFKGLFREEMGRFLEWDDSREKGLLETLFGEGKPGVDDTTTESRRLVFSDFVLSPHVREVISQQVMDDVGDHNNAKTDEDGFCSAKVLDCLTHLRAFTRISEEGTADKGSLRYARCVNQGLVFYSTIVCSELDENLVLEALPYVKWIGTSRNRGFGHVCVEVENLKDKETTAEKGGEG